MLCQVFPSSGTQKRPADKIKALNALYLAAAKKHPQVTYLETWPLFAGPDGDATAAEFPDLLHPNETGYAKWAAALRPVFATLGLLRDERGPFTPEEGFESLFNGRDLTGWGYRPTSETDKASAARWQASDPAAAAWPIVTEAVGFDGLTATPDGRFAVIGGRLVVTAPREYRKIQQLWTTREFPRDFVLKLEFRATPNADSGVYVRGPQLQCRDYRLAGPYKELKRYKPQDWNELVITVKGGVAQATCNGEVLEAALAVPGVRPDGCRGRPRPDGIPANPDQDGAGPMTTAMTTPAVASVETIRSRFPALERRHNGAPVAYFDGPGGTQVPQSVVDAMGDYLLHHNANTHWAYPTSIETDAAARGRARGARRLPGRPRRPRSPSAPT